MTKMEEIALNITSSISRISKFEPDNVEPKLKQLVHIPEETKYKLKRSTETI